MTEGIETGWPSGENERGFNSPYLEIESPPYLAPDQNFFDQEPFISPLSPYDRWPRGQIGIRKGLVNFVRKWTEEPATRPQLSALLASPSPMGINILTSQREVSEPLHKTLKYLSELPYWTEYVKSRLDSYIYNSDGERRKGRNVPEDWLPISYAAWIYEKQAREQRLQQLNLIQVLDETFPQNLMGQSLAEVLPKGSRRINMRWRIRKIAKSGS